MITSSLRAALFVFVVGLLLAACGPTPSPLPLGQRSLSVAVTYTPGGHIPANQYEIAIDFENEHFPAASESFSCSGQPLERGTGNTGFVAWVGRYPFDPGSPASAGATCQYDDQGTSFSFTLDAPDVVQFTVPAPGSAVPLTGSTTVAYTVRRSTASVSLAAIPTRDVPTQVPADQQAGARLGTQTGSGQLTLTPQLLGTVRPGSGLIRATAQSTVPLAIAQVRSATVQYVASATLAVTWV